MNRRCIGIVRLVESQSHSFPISRTTHCRASQVTYTYIYISWPFCPSPSYFALCATMPKLTILPDPSDDHNYTAFNTAIDHIGIFPPIGIARVGDSDLDCFLAPEVPGHTSPPVGLKTDDEVRCPLASSSATRSPCDLQFKFRDAKQKLRRQVPPPVNMKG